MKKNNKKRKPRKKLSTKWLLILVLTFTVIFLLFGICIGFIINAIINPTSSDLLINIVCTLLVGIIYMVLLIILMRDSDSANVQPLKWYINNVLISLTLNLIITAVTVFISGPNSDSGTNYLVGFLIFPFIGIITTPNIVRYVKKDTTKWKGVFYHNGNLHTHKDNDDFYRIKIPVSFEKKILLAIFKEQFLNLLVVIGFMLLMIYVSVHHMIRDNSYTDNVVTNLIQTRANRDFGLILFLTLLILSFAIPIIAFYISNALKKIRTVKNHEYIGYHVVASGVRNSKITIYNGKRYYMYKYCTCVGIKEKKVRQTPGTLIFIPDDVLFFPDNSKYKVDRYK